MNNLTKVPEGLETEECYSKDIKVGMDFITELRAEAHRQKVRRSTEALLDAVTGDSQDLLSILEMDEISEDFELTEE